MKLKISPYRRYIKDLKKYYNKGGIDLVTIACCSLVIPLLVSYYLLLKEYPNDKQLKEKYKKLKEFYDYIELEE